MSSSERSSAPLLRSRSSLVRAQELSRQAFDAITRAQVANEYDMGGHAANAREFLRQANEEIKMSAITINQRR
jgi:hypothetical protein